MKTQKLAVRRISAEGFKTAVSAACLISLLCRDFLWKDGLASEDRLKRWSVPKTGGAKNGPQGYALSSRVILKEALRDFSQTLERNLSQTERYFLKTEIGDFVEAYELCHLNVVDVQTENKGDVPC